MTALDDAKTICTGTHPVPFQFELSIGFRYILQSPLAPKQDMGAHAELTGTDPHINTNLLFHYLALPRP